MGIGGPFMELGRFLDECEQRDSEVSSVEIGDRTSSQDGVLSADVSITVSIDDRIEGRALCAPTVDDDGTVRFALESTRRLVPTSEYDVEVDPSDVAFKPGGALTITFSARTTIDAPERSANRTSSRVDPVPVHDTAAAAGETERTSATGSDGDVPPFKDPDLLSDVYESCDTFAEMADELEMDVTAETVRRYMIDYDIHQPNTYKTGGESDERAPVDGGAEDGEPDAGHGGTVEKGAAHATAQTEEPVVISDGIGLPDDVTVDTLIETVKRSNTIREVKQDIGLGRQDALEMLQDLNLLDLVMGRLATEAERDITREEVVDRLREASTAE